MKALRILLMLTTLLVTSLAYAEPVDLNHADVATLALNIKGVGLKKAQAIVEYRIKNGNFIRVEDIIKVNGIGKKLLENNRNNFFIQTIE